MDTNRRQRRGQRKVYHQDLLNGYKKKNYELTYRQTTSHVKLDDKLPKTHLAELRRIQTQELGENKRVPLEKIKKLWNQERYGNLVELINKHPPKNIEEKIEELKKMGIKPRKEEATRIYFWESGESVSVEWVLEWVEPPKEAPKNEND